MELSELETLKTDLVNHLAYIEASLQSIEPHAVSLELSKFPEIRASIVSIIRNFYREVEQAYDAKRTELLRGELQ